jgi:hypothetical protein
MKTNQSVISRLEEGGGAKNRIDPLARLADALGRYLVLSSRKSRPRGPRTPSMSPDQPTPFRAEAINAA